MDVGSRYDGQDGCHVGGARDVTDRMSVMST
jgi:hypothetical protein